MLPAELCRVQGSSHHDPDLLGKCPQVLPRASDEIQRLALDGIGHAQNYPIFGIILSSRRFGPPHPPRGIPGWRQHSMPAVHPLAPLGIVARFKQGSILRINHASFHAKIRRNFNSLPSSKQTDRDRSGAAHFRLPDSKRLKSGVSKRVSSGSYIS